MTIGEKIKVAREHFGYSQEELAKKAGISRTYVIQLENNHSSKPSAAILFRVAAALETTIGHLLGKVESLQTSDLKLSPDMENAIKIYPELAEVKDLMPSWKHRGKYPATPEAWYAIYNILKNGKKA